MKKLKDIKSAEDKADREIDKLEKRLKIARSKRDKIGGRYPFRCKKCGLAYSLEEVGYRVFHTRKEEMHCMPMGEYDVRQYVVRQEIACCPKCGHNFKVNVWYDEILHSTRTYGRWDDKPDFKPCGVEFADKKIKKIDKDRVEYFKRNHQT